MHSIHWSTPVTQQGCSRVERGAWCAAAGARRRRPENAARVWVVSTLEILSRRGGRGNSRRPRHMVSEPGRGQGKRSARPSPPPAYARAVRTRAGHGGICRGAVGRARAPARRQTAAGRCGRAAARAGCLLLWRAVNFEAPPLLDRIERGWQAAGGGRRGTWQCSGRIHGQVLAVAVF
ncbi:MAG: hypothetical protein J3K34DRAFT_197754 [Monoraphidium minutum]|nr:MAG: hypothetical protein J3K34DRAFT_197754 [Monoraphidium minutum]